MIAFTIALIMFFRNRFFGVTPAKVFDTDYNHLKGE